MGKLSAGVATAIAYRATLLEKTLAVNGVTMPPHLECDFSLSVWSVSQRSGGWGNIHSDVSDFILTGIGLSSMGVSWAPASEGGLFGLPLPSVSNQGISISYFTSQDVSSNLFVECYESQFTKTSARTSGAVNDTGYLHTAGLLSLPSSRDRIDMVLSLLIRESPEMGSGLLARLAGAIGIGRSKVKTSSEGGYVPVPFLYLKDCKFSQPIPSFNPGSSNATQWSVSVLARILTFYDFANIDLGQSGSIGDGYSTVGGAPVIPDLKL